MTSPPQDASTGPQDARPEENDPPPSLHCPVCGHTEFQREAVSAMSRWQVRTFHFTVMVCRQCRFSMHFLNPAAMDR